MHSAIIRDQGMILIQIFIIQVGEITRILSGLVINNPNHNSINRYSSMSHQQRSLEISLEKLSESIRTKFDQTGHDIQNIHATLKNLEQQIGQIALQRSDREPGKFISQTVLNPKGNADCKAVRIFMF